MVTRGTLGAHGCSIICEASSKGRVAAYLTSPWMPPFSPHVVVVALVPVPVTTQAGGQEANGALPNSIQLPWLVSPDQPSAATHGGSMRPVEAVAKLGFAVPVANPAASAAQSALAQ